MLYMKKLIVLTWLLIAHLILISQNNESIISEMNKSQPECIDVTKNAIRLIVLERVQNPDSLDLIMAEWFQSCLYSEPYLRTEILFQLKNLESIHQNISAYKKHCIPGYSTSYYYGYNNEIYATILEEFTTNLADSLSAHQAIESDELLWCLYFGSDRSKFNREAAKDCYVGHILYSSTGIYSSTGTSNIDDYTFRFNPGVGICIPIGPISNTIGINTTARIGLDLYNHEHMRGSELRFGAKIIGNQNGVSLIEADSTRGNVETIYTVGINGYQEYPIRKGIVFRAGIMAGVDILNTNFKIKNDTTTFKITTAALTPSVGIWTHRANRSNYGLEVSYAPSWFFLNSQLSNDLRGGFFEVMLRIKFNALDRW